MTIEHRKLRGPRIAPVPLGPEAQSTDPPPWEVSDPALRCGGGATYRKLCKLLGRPLSKCGWASLCRAHPAVAGKRQEYRLVPERPGNNAVLLDTVAAEDGRWLELWLLSDDTTIVGVARG